MESRGSKPPERRRPRSSVQSGERGSEASRSIDREQHRRFIETARQLECDEDKERFEEKLKRIATAKPKPTPQKGRRKTEEPS
jgi:hypothetical protein